MADFLPGGNAFGQGPGSPYSASQPVSLGSSFSFTGLISAIQNVAMGIQQLINALGSAFATLTANNSFSGVNFFTQPVHLPVHTLATLPTITSADIGAICFCSNGRNTGEGGGSGTGCLVQVQIKSTIATWCSVWSGVATVA